MAALVIGNRGVFEDRGQLRFPRRYSHHMIDSHGGRKTRLQQFWLAEQTLVSARRLGIICAIFAVFHFWRYWRGSSVSPAFLVTVATLAIVFTGISVVSWVKRRKHNGLTAD